MDEECWKKGTGLLDALGQYSHYSSADTHQETSNKSSLHIELHLRAKAELPSMYQAWFV